MISDAYGEHSETCSKKGRGMARRSLELIEAMRVAAEAAQPITGRGVGYKLFDGEVRHAAARPAVLPRHR
jgi:hypothetical protein